MNKPISRRQHALTDYSYVPLVAAAPSLVGFRRHKAPTTLCYALSSAALLSSLFTRAEWGVARVLPYRAHLALDALLGAAALGFARHRRARNTLLAVGAFGLAAGLLSRPDELPGPQPSRPR